MGAQAGALLAAFCAQGASGRVGNGGGCVPRRRGSSYGDLSSVGPCPCAWGWGPQAVTSAPFVRMTPWRQPPTPHRSGRSGRWTCWRETGRPMERRERPEGQAWGPVGTFCWNGHPDCDPRARRRGPGRGIWLADRPATPGPWAVLASGSGAQSSPSWREARPWAAPRTAVTPPPAPVPASIAETEAETQVPPLTPGRAPGPPSGTQPPW